MGKKGNIGCSSEWLCVVSNPSKGGSRTHLSQGSICHHKIRLKKWFIFIKEACIPVSLKRNCWQHPYLLSHQIDIPNNSFNMNFVYYVIVRDHCQFSLLLLSKFEQISLKCHASVTQIHWILEAKSDNNPWIQWASNTWSIPDCLLYVQFTIISNIVWFIIVRKAIHCVI